MAKKETAGGDQVYTYTATGHVVIDEKGGGHIYPDTKANRESPEKRTTVKLTEVQAKRFGSMLVKGDPVKADNKQLTDADMSTK